jgi:membrane protein
VSRFAPGETAQVVSEATRDALEKRAAGANILVTVVGVIGLLFSSSGVFTTLDKAINRAWGCEYKSGLIKEKLLSFGMVLSIAVVMLISLIVSAMLTFAQTTSNFFLKTFLGGALDLAILWQILTALVPILLNTGILILVFRLLPRCLVRVREVWLGALLTAVGWEILKQGFAFYLGNFANNATIYGTLGAFFSLTTWIFLSSLLLLTGAEFTSEYARALRLYTGQKIPADAKASAAGVNPSPSARVWRGHDRPGAS